MSESGDVVVVTGGSRGIGAAVVRMAVRDGCAVCFSYGRDEAAADDLRRELEGAGGRVAAVRADVAEAGAAQHLFDEAERAFGPVTALVNNAGITGPIGAFRNLDPAALRRIVEVNVVGLMLCAQEAVRRWERHGIPGRMVNLSSTAATLGSAHEFVPYAATKGAVESFTIGLARETAAAGIRVNAVAPGTVQTGIHAAAGDPERPARVAARIPMGRVGEPEEVAEAILWLLSDKAGYVTGAVLRVSGGL